ncbi:hypothetical protein I8752_25730 [Nostocaceae cyanobacterium CENA369]|uniref:Uncharacterized protein n=1 Tax=Dendronalium phyllosphericum CENA369 TaxID=1725256 RepID=A0A8J7I5I2_9NOST|nr:hypothetical protein [Dendronalium phyllosphericum]MBH8576330.1 hypothetical protein [Dendronalium phyllosphericum CENA369]
MITETGLFYQNLISSKLVLGVASVISFAATFATVTQTQAAQVKYRSPGNVSAIDGLVVDGITYDVTFRFDTFTNLFGSPDSSNFKTPTFWNNSQGATNTVDSFISLFSNESSIPQQINNFSYVLVPYQSIKAEDKSWYTINKIDDFITNWSTVKGESKDIFVLSNEKANYALFQAKASPAVPEPKSSIVGLGLALIPGIKYFKNRWMKVRHK